MSILTDPDIAEAQHLLWAGGFRTFVLEYGTICGYKGEGSYGFRPRYGRFCREAIQRAIEDNR